MSGAQRRPSGAVFISYRRADSAAMSGRIFDRLSHHFGDGAVFIDIDDIPLGADYRTHVNDVLGKCDLILAVVGPRWTGPREDGGFRIQERADLVRLELEAGMARNIPVIPLLVDGAAMPSAAVLPASLQAFAFRNAMEIDAGKDFRVHIERLIRDIEQKLATARTSAEAPAAKVPQAAAKASEVPKRPVRVASGSRAMTILKLAVVLAVIAIVVWGQRADREPPPVTPEPVTPDQPAPETPGEHTLEGTEALLFVGGWTVSRATIAGQPECFIKGVPEAQSLGRDARDWPPSLTVTHRKADGVRGELTIDPGIKLDTAQPAVAVLGYFTFTLAIDGASQRLLLLSDPEEERRLVGAMRFGALLDVSVTSVDGRAILDRYDLTGFSQAFDEMDKACPP